MGLKGVGGIGDGLGMHWGYYHYYHYYHYHYYCYYYYYELLLRTTTTNYYYELLPLLLSLTVCAEPEQQGLDQQGLYVKGPKPYLCSYLANFVFICFVLSFFVFICLFLFLFVFICFCLSFICNCLLLFYLGPGFVLYVYNTSPRPQSALV